MSALEHLLLRDAEALAARVGDADRAAIARALALGRQKVRAGDALFSNGHVAEGLRLTREALDETLAAVPFVARVLGESGDLRAVLAARGVPERAISRVLEARDRASGAPLPARDADVSRAHAALYDLLQFGRRDVDRALDAAAKTPQAIRRSRALRIALAVLAHVVVVVAIVIAARPRHGTHVEASAQFGTGHQFAATNAADGHADTEWLLPDAASGSLDIHVSPPRRVDRVVITNAHNPPYQDRAAREIRIEVSGGGRTLRTIEGTFDALESDPAPRAFEVGVDGVEQVRVVVLSWHRAGGGLAEVALE